MDPSAVSQVRLMTKRETSLKKNMWGFPMDNVHDANQLALLNSQAQMTTKEEMILDHVLLSNEKLKKTISHFNE